MTAPRTGRRLLIAAGVCAALGIVARFALVGYTTTGRCLLFAAVCLAFFSLTVRRGLRRLTVAALACLGVGFCLFLAAEVPVLIGARSDKDTSGDYLIVCGAAVNGTTPSLSLRDRLTEALAWLEENPDGKAVLSGGQGEGEDVTEARAMADWLTEQGVDPARLLLEEDATSSYENLAFSLDVIAADGGDPAGRVTLLSSEYHLFRLRYMARRLGCRDVCRAARTTYVTLAANYAVREAFAVWKCWVFGIE